MYRSFTSAAHFMTSLGCLSKKATVQFCPAVCCQVTLTFNLSAGFPSGVLVTPSGCCCGWWTTLEVKLNESRKDRWLIVTTVWPFVHRSARQTLCYCLVLQSQRSSLVFASSYNHIRLCVFQLGGVERSCGEESCLPDAALRVPGQTHGQSFRLRRQNSTEFQR